MRANKHIYLTAIISQYCPLGLTHFCDGTPNLSQTQNPYRVEPCEYFIHGKCTETHIKAAVARSKEDKQ